MLLGSRRSHFNFSWVWLYSKPLPGAGPDLVRSAAIFLGILGIGWWLVGLPLVGKDMVMRRFPLDVEDNLEARTIETQLEILQRFGSILIWAVALALALLTIPGVQPLAACSIGTHVR